MYFAFGSYVPQYYNDKSELSEAEPVHVTAGSTTSGIDAALQPTVGQISGKVTNASTLAAVEGVEVCALTSADEDQRLHEHGLGWCVHAHGASSWRIPGRVHRTGSSELTRRSTTKARRSSPKPTAVSVTADSTTTGIDAALTAGGQISGTVTDAVTKPHSRVPRCAPITSRKNSSGTSTAAPTPTPPGSTRFTGLAGRRIQGVFFAFGSYAPQYYNDKSELSEAEPVHVTAGSTTSGIDAALQPTVGQISGKVTNASTLAAVEGVYVCALTSADEDRGCTSTDSTGMYTLTGLPAGEYRVVFIAPEAANYAPQYYEGKAKFAEADRCR